MGAKYIIFGIILLITLFLFFYEINRNEGTFVFNNSSHGDNDSMSMQLDVREEYKIFPEVWSQNSPYGTSYEFKVNCFGEYDRLETCFLWDLNLVRVVSPNRTIYNLNKDFNINNYSGEVTRRWVLYGPYNGSLPATGNYTFEYIVDSEGVIVRDVVSYEPNIIGYPTSVIWERRADDLFISWTSPDGIHEDTFYKVILWEEYGTPDIFVSDRFEWNDVNATLPNVPLIDGGNYSVNVAVYFKEGYAFSEYIKFQW